MSTIRNKVQLIGNTGIAPEIRNFESGKKVARFTMATNEIHWNSKGEKVEDCQWHNVVCWGKTAAFVEKFVTKGKELAIEGKLLSRVYETSEGERRYTTEILASEILLLGSADKS